MPPNHPKPFSSSPKQSKSIPRLTTTNSWKRFLYKIILKSPKKQSKHDKYRNKFLKKIQKSKLPTDETALIQSILRMDALTARDVMVPRVDVISLDMHASKKELHKYLQKTAFSRCPIYQKNIDNLKGIIHIRDLFKIMIASQGHKKIDLLKVLSPPFYVPESRKVKHILKDLQENKIHMAIVVDEYGGFAGLVTMEDILEEIIGDVQDEFDTEPDEIRPLNNHSYSVAARTSLDTLNEAFDLKLESNDFDTLGGLLINQQGQIPKLNQTILHEGITFKIIAKRRNSITRIRMDFNKKPPSPKSPP